LIVWPSSVVYMMMSLGIGNRLTAIMELFIVDHMSFILKSTKMARDRKKSTIKISSYRKTDKVTLFRKGIKLIRTKSTKRSSR